MTTTNTSSIYEFGRHCKSNYNIQVEIDNMRVHCNANVVAEFKYNRLGIDSKFQLCGKIGTNHWKKDDYREHRHDYEAISITRKQFYFPSGEPVQFRLYSLSPGKLFLSNKKKSNFKRL